MFDMSLPWWEFIARGAIVYAALMLMMRVAGKRTVGQFTPFDLLVVMLLSESVSNSLSGGDDSVSGGLILAATLIAFNFLFAFATAHSRRIETLTEGRPVLVGRDGRLFEEVIKRQRIGIGEIEKALRESDCDLDEMRYVFLESDGSVSVQKKKQMSS